MSQAYQQLALSPDEKRCTKCKHVQALSAFCHDKGNADGYAYWCRSCSAAAQKARREGNAVQRRTSVKVLRSLREQGLNKCPRCGEIKSFSDFNQVATLPHGLSPYCTACTRKYQRAEYQRRGKERSWIHLYGLTRAEYENRLNAQNGVCAICRKQKRVIHKGALMHMLVDHNHVTGQVRGLLCDDCNFVLGRCHDDPALLRAAAAYLEAWQEVE